MTEAQLIHEGWFLWLYKPRRGAWPSGTAEPTAWEAWNMRYTVNNEINKEYAALLRPYG